MTDLWEAILLTILLSDWRRNQYEEWCILNKWPIQWSLWCHMWRALYLCVASDPSVPFILWPVSCIVLGRKQPEKMQWYDTIWEAKQRNVAYSILSSRQLYGVMTGENTWPYNRSYQYSMKKLWLFVKRNILRPVQLTINESETETDPEAEEIWYELMVFSNEMTGNENNENNGYY